MCLGRVWSWRGQSLVSPVKYSMLPWPSLHFHMDQRSIWKAADLYAQMAGKGTQLVHTALSFNSSSTLEGIQSI